MAFTFVLTGRSWICCIMSTGRCPGLWKTLGFQPTTTCWVTNAPNGATSS